MARRPISPSSRQAQGSSFELSTRVRAAWGEEGWQALVGSGWGDEFRLDGDAMLFWVTRIERRDPYSPPGQDEYPQSFNGRSFRDAPLGPERLARIMASLALDVSDPAVQASILKACNALVGQVIDTADRASVLTTFELDARGASRGADDTVVTLFEPPHLEGRTFVFCVNVEHDPKSRGPAFLRLAVDGDTLAVSSTYLCRGRAGPAGS